jgi:Mn-dependent DtxR family transcriptional regulator
MDYATDLMSKASWILVEIDKNEGILMDDLAKKMGHKIYTAIDSDCKKLARKGLIVISDEGICPHCGKPIVGLRVKKGSRMVRITKEGSEIAKALKTAAAIIDETLEKE